MSNFFHSLIVQRPQIEAGKYILVIDVIWDKCVELSPQFDDVLVRAYCSQHIALTELDQYVGEEYLAKAFKKYAKSSSNTQYRNYYRKQDAEYGQKLYRVSDPNTNIGFYGFCYRKNDSSYTSSEKLVLTLDGLDFVG